MKSPPPRTIALTNTPHSPPSQRTTYPLVSFRVKPKKSVPELFVCVFFRHTLQTCQFKGVGFLCMDVQDECVRPQWWWRDRNIHLVGVSGNIGVGKTTLIKRLKKYGVLQRSLDGILQANGHKNAQVVVEFMLEPVDLWIERGYLGAFMEDPDTNGLAFQLIVFNTHVEAVQRILAKYYDQPDTTLILVVERTMFDQMLFWKTQGDMQRKCFTQLADTSYDMIWKLRDAFIPRVSLILLLSPKSLDSAMARIKRRARGEETPVEVRKDNLPKTIKMSWDPTEGDLDSTGAESPSPPPLASSEEKESSGVTMEYLQALDTKHRAWFTEPLAFPPDCREEGIPCTHLSTDVPYHESEEALKQFATTMAATIYARVLK